MLAIIAASPEVHDLTLCEEKVPSGRNLPDRLHPRTEGRERAESRGWTKGKQPRRMSPTGVATERVQALPPLTVGGINVAVPCPGADQNSPAALRAFHERQVSDRPIVHAEFQVWS